MTLYEQWKGLAEMQATPAQQNAYWSEYFALETENYKKILARHEEPFAGKLEELAGEFGMTPVVFTGFMDGANDSLKESCDIGALAEDTEIALAFDFEKLFWNMLEAKAKWLYTLPEWEGVLPQEKRDALTREWRTSRQAVSEKTVGRNDPCPCGSGKKYKKCCGK